jgi:hypothetical protein
MRFTVAILFAVTCCAHTMSMSSGDAVLEGTKLTYTLTMPLYEITHTATPEQSLLAHIAFGDAQLTTHECHTESARESYVCRAVYQFRAAPETLPVHCTFFEVTVPNHVHLLRATRGEKRDQAAFDSAFTSATLRFHRSTAASLGARQVVSAATQIFTGLMPILLLVTLAMAAANWRDLALLSAFFLAGQLVGAVFPWQPPPRFLEAAVALAIAYCAVEILFLPRSRAFWVRDCAMGLIAGLIAGLVLAAFIRRSDAPFPYAFAGTAAADLAILCSAGALVFLFPLTRRICAGLSLAASLCWYVVALSR